MDKDSFSVAAIDVIWPEGYFDLLARFSPGLVLLFSLLLIEWPGKLGAVIQDISKKDVSIAFQALLLVGLLALAWCLGFVCASLGAKIERLIVQRVWEAPFNQFAELNQQSAWKQHKNIPTLATLRTHKGDGMLHEWLKVHLPHKDRYLVKKAAESRLPCALIVALSLTLVFHPVSFALQRIWGPFPDMPKHDWLMFGIAAIAMVLVVPVAQREVEGRIRRQFDMLAAYGSYTLSAFHGENVKPAQVVADGKKSG